MVSRKAFGSSGEGGGFLLILEIALSGDLL